MRTRPVKLFIAVLTALGLLVLSAPPAGANTVSVEETGGTYTAAGNVFDLTPGSGGAPPCPGKPSTQSLTGQTLMRWFVGGTTTRYFQLGTPPSGQWYQEDIQYLTWSGTYSGAGPTYALSGTFVERKRYYAVPPCNKTAGVCVVTTPFTILGTSTYNGSLPTAVTGDTFTINATSTAPHMSVSSCSAPFVSWAGQTASYTGWSFQVL